MNTHHPGPGWKYLASGVWQHADGTRVSMGGFCLLKDGEFISGHNYGEAHALHLMTKINGGKQRRGVMAWANTLRVKT